MLEKNRYRLKVLSRLMPLANGVKRFILFNFVLSILAIILSFITPLLYKMFIDQVILQSKISLLGYVVAGYFIIHGMTILIEYIKNYGNNRIINRLNFRIKAKIWKNYFNQEFVNYEHQAVGDMKMRFEDDVQAISSFSGYQTIDYLISYMTLACSFIFLLLIEWRLALFSVLAIPITFILDHWLSKREKVLNEEQRGNDQQMSTWLHASIQGWREIKALNLQNNQKIKFIKFVRKYALYYAKWIHYWTLRALIIPTIRDELFMKFGLYFLGGLLIIYGDLRIGDLLVFAMYYSMLSKAINTVSTTDADLQSQIPYVERVLEELDKVLPSKRKRKIDSHFLDVITFENVCFSYPDSEEKIIQNLNLRIERGERVAITGRSGSGKTTILKLLTGLVSPTSGNIMYSGVDISEFNTLDLHKRIGFVMQEVTLFNTTIAENLLYGNSKATIEELIEACKKAYIYDFICSLPEGLDTVIGERGIKLSGGQRQRIVLARLFLREVDIFLFDEATSALDQYSESIVNEAIRNISTDKTIIVVAHRESSVGLCDRKIILDEVS